MILIVIIIRLASQSAGSPLCIGDRAVVLGPAPGSFHGGVGSAKPDIGHAARIVSGFAGGEVLRGEIRQDIVEDLGILGVGVDLGEIAAHGFRKGLGVGPGLGGLVEAIGMTRCAHPGIGCARERAFHHISDRNRHGLADAQNPVTGLHHDIIDIVRSVGATVGGRFKVRRRLESDDAAGGVDVEQVGVRPAGDGISQSGVGVGIGGGDGVDRLGGGDVFGCRCCVERGYYRGAVGCVQQHVGDSAVRGQNIRPAVAVEVGHRQYGITACRIAHLRIEGPVAIAEQDGYICAEAVRDHNIRRAIAVHVGHRDFIGTRACPIGHLRPEGPVAIAEPDGDGIVASVRDHKILLAVAVEVGHRDRLGINACPIGHLRLEGPVAIVDQNGNSVVIIVRGHKVRLAVAVDVDHRGYAGTTACRISHRRVEGPVAFAEQNGHSVAVEVRDHKILPAVAVDVSHRD